MIDLKKIYHNVKEVIGNSSSELETLYASSLPLILDEVESNYPAYVVPLDARVKTLEGKLKEFGGLKEELEKIMKQIQNINRQPSKIDDSLAEKQTIQLLKEYKIKGKTKINVLKIASELNLPIEQIDDILERLEDEGLVRDVENE